MQFHEFNDGWAEIRRIVKDKTGKERKEARERFLAPGPIRYFDELAKTLHDMFTDGAGGRAEMETYELCSAMTNVTCHQNWRAFGAPYYKVWPEMSWMLSEVSMSMEGKYLNLPYPSFALLMPQGEKHAMQEPGCPVMKSCLVSRLDTGHSAGGIVMEYKSWKDRAYSLHIEYQFDGHEANGQPIVYCLTMPMYLDRPIEECVQIALTRSSEYSDGSYVPSEKFIEKLLRLIVSVTFFGVDQHEFVMPDLPKKKIVKVMKALKDGDDSKIKEAANKAEHQAKKHGTGFGWSIGSETDLPTSDVEFRYEGGKKLAKGERKFAGVRRGHMRLQPYGGRDKPDYRMIFIKPTVIRPDLPMKASRGYTLKDKILDRVER